MMDTRDGEHAHKIQEHRGPSGKGTHASPQHAEAAEVEDNEGHDAHPIDLVGLIAHLFGATGAVVGVDPLGHGGGHAAEKGGRSGVGCVHSRRELKAESMCEDARAQVRFRENRLQ